MTLDINSPGNLVTYLDRPWVVLPSNDPELILLKPLGGSDEEITGLFLPLMDYSNQPKSYSFVKPAVNDIGEFTSAKLLYNASRLSFRSVVGPFRSLGKLSFRPRSYQMIPLIMALKQQTTRLLIADDVGVGKTIEALLIAKELYERKEIERFAVVCLPHLCEQWQDEIKSKFGLDAVIIRSGTVTALERQIRTNETIFTAFPFQVISIDYIKFGNKRQVFLDHCPELVIVDEAHTCARPAGANKSQQQRHHLLYDISKKENQHLALLTATPHSGKQEEFQSLLGLLNPDFEKIELSSADRNQRRKLADHFVQRRRADVIKWLDEETNFPERESVDKPYEIGTSYAELFNDVLNYAREVVADSKGDRRRLRYSYWDVLALLRGIMSSPSAGVSMLINKAKKKQTTFDEQSEVEFENEGEELSVLDADYSSDDNLPLSVLGKAGKISNPESKRLLNFANELEKLKGISLDQKAKQAVSQIKQFINEGHNPIVFCRYIQTANYLGEVFNAEFSKDKYKNIHIEVITSELNDELRREKIVEMNKSKRRLLISTDCLSEGINLQEGFDAILHYDLPWNPNRLEQREGRIDRFGQRSPLVKVALLYGSNNPMDGVVLDVLLNKAREIRKSIGISVPLPENSSSIMEAVTNAILLKSSVEVRSEAKQLSLFEDDEINKQKNIVAKAFDEAEQREKATRSIFAQNAIKASEVEEDLREVDNAIGNVQAVENFVIQSLRYMGVQVDKVRNGYKVYTTNIPQRLKGLLTYENNILISFQSPTPHGFMYIGRNHPFTEYLSQYIINASLENSEHSAARTAVIRSDEIDTKTVLFQFRVRNVVEEQRTKRQIVAEEMWLWGYKGNLKEENYIDNETAMEMLMNVTPTENMEIPAQEHFLNKEMEWVNDSKRFREVTDKVALQRAENLVESHTRFRKLVRGSNYEVVEPVLPMDVLGIYILLPTT